MSTDARADPAWTTTDHAVGYGDRLLRGRNLRLRATAESDLPLLAAWWNEGAHTALQQDRVKPRPKASVQDMFRAWSTNSPGSLDTGFSVATLETGELVGHTTLYATAPSRTATFSIMLGPHHVGHGYGVEATRLMLGYAFAELGLHRVELQAAAFNDRAIRAYERAGFTVEGRRREVVFHAGRFHDHVLMGVLAHEYPADS